MKRNDERGMGLDMSSFNLMKFRKTWYIVDITVPTLGIEPTTVVTHLAQPIELPNKLLHTRITVADKSLQQ